MDNNRLKIIAVLVTGFSALAVAANSPYYGVKPDETAGTAEGHISGKWGVAASSQTADSYTITLDGPTGKGTFYTVESGTVTANHVQAATIQASTVAANTLAVAGNATVGGNASVTGGLTAQGDITAQSNLHVQGTGNISGMMNATGGVTSTTGTFNTVNAAVVNVATDTGAGILNTYNGDVAIGGDLAVAYNPETAVMAHMDGAEGAAAIPNSVSPASFTVLNAGYITQTKKKFGSASFYMMHWNDGAYITSLPQISSNTFTIDFWVYTAGCPNWQTARAFLVLNPNWTTSGGADMYNAATNNALAMSHTNYNGNDLLMISGPGCSGGNTNFYWSSYNAGWHHVALVRQTYAGGLTLYVDGISKLSNICVGANLDVSAGAYIGYKQTRNQDSYTTASAVYMDELRIDVGVARWSSNFSPPNAPYYQAADKGRLLVGNTAIASPGARLHVANNGYGRAVQVDAANGDIALNAGNGVILGNSQYSPNAVLDVRPNGVFPYLLAISTDIAGAGLAVAVSSNGRTSFSNTITEAYGIAAATGVFSGAVSAASFSGVGTSLTSLNASNLASGTVADARLSANVPLLNGNQTFTGANTFSKTITETYGISASTAQIALVQGTTAQFTLMQATTGQFSVMNAASVIQLNGTNINSAGTLSNVAYKGQDNNFTAPQTFQSSVTANDIAANYGVKASTAMFAFMGIGGAEPSSNYVVDITTNASLPLGVVLHVENTYTNQIAIAARGSDADGLGITARAKTAFNGMMAENGTGLVLTQDPNSSHATYVRANITGYGTDWPIYNTIQYAPYAVSSDVYHAEMGANGPFTGKFINFISSGTVRFAVDNTGTVYAADTITTAYGVNASTMTVSGVAILGGAAFHGAKTHSELQSLACETLPCMTLSSDSPYELFVATGTEAGQWQGQISGGGP